MGAPTLKGKRIAGSSARDSRRLVRVRPRGGFEADRWELQGEAWEPVTRRSLSWAEFSRGWTCDHSKMRYCCRRPCGHLVCSCGLAWDEGAER